MREFIKKCEQKGFLKVINDEVDTELELGHIAYVEAKKADSKVLLFNNVVCKNKGVKYEYPVIMNVFANKEVLEMVLGRSADSIADEINSLLHTHIPSGFADKISLFSKLFSLKNIAPKRKINQNANCFYKQISLKDIPILKTWSDDGGDFITMGQVYTQSLDGKQNNLGMYRLQVHDYEKGILGMHFQLHKDSNHFFHEYKKAGKKMPVAIAIGDDPLHILCAQAPLPKGIFELMLFGFIKKSGAKLVKCQTNEIYVPNNSDFVIEGFIDTDEFMIEGPFGDHTGFYTKALEYPVMNVTKVWAKKDAIYNATVVGKPPLEDKWMGYATERIFLPLFQTSVSDLLDYKMPENGVFHNLILAKINNLYPNHATQIMHAFFGVGQMSFVKHAIFVDNNAPKLDDYENLTPYMLDRFDAKKMYFCDGIIDELDHASEYCFGSKLGVDLCDNFGFSPREEVVKEQSAQKTKINDEFLEALKQVKGFLEAKFYYENTKNPILCIRIDKQESIKNILEKINLNFVCWRGVVVFLDEENKLYNPYFLVWRVVNNIDAKRDIFIKGDLVFVDATKKYPFEGFEREWPKEVLCDKAIIKDLIKRKILEDDDKFYDKLEIY